MSVNVEVKKNPNENGVSLIRRFTKRMQGAGVIPRIRSIRWASRKPSELRRKKNALVVLEKRAQYKLLKKLGKLPEEKPRGRR
ncbi:MAG: hypothetical protein PHS95_01510 [Candidatus Pacebacteria bacterium]|nr:hypothetical protein [Candidatus Paceibacterota bacterium]